MKSVLQEFMSGAAADVESVLNVLLPAEDVAPTRLHQAIRWSVFAGGKRFRPALTIAVGESLGASRDDLMRTAAAVEMIHTFSLIHDDLPAMDNDDLRRGRATCHKQFDQATAILAGDALQSIAFGTIADDENLDGDQRIRLISGLATASATPFGMVAGQQLDIDAEQASTDLVGLESIHRSKTGALISFSATAGAIIARSDDTTLALIEEFSGHLGLLFQIVDDIIDVTQSSETLGKTAGKDAASQKATYPSIFGVDGSIEYAATSAAAAIEAIEPLGEHASLLIELVRSIQDRSS